MKIKDLILFLQAQPEDTEIAYQKYSEQCAMKLNDIQVTELCLARPDGWIQNKRPDKPTQMYLLFPGN